MARKIKLKVNRGRLEDERRKSDDRYEYQRVMLFILPLVMIAVLVVGIYFGYLSYRKTHTKLGSVKNNIVVNQSGLSDEQSAYLVKVVSSAKPLDKDFVPSLSDAQGVKVSSLAADDLNKMVEDAAKDGVKLKVSVGYISFEEQNKIYSKAVEDYKKKNKCSVVKAEAAVRKTTPDGGESEHQTGLLVKFSSSSEKDFSKSRECAWLVKNSVRYGFVLRYPDTENTGGLAYSSDLYRYVGVSNAALMRAYDMNLDEFVQYLGLQ